ncbi:MAG: hypothetical protein ACYC5A_00990 [Thermoleophilia bacterium]
MAFDERGSIMGSLIFLGVVILIMAIVVIDGVSVYYSFRDASNTTREAAELAAETYKETRDDNQAARAAEAYCREKGLDYIDFGINRDFGNLFEVTCGTEADTYAFKHIPYLKELVYQQSTNSARPL